MKILSKEEEQEHYQYVSFEYYGRASADEALGRPSRAGSSAGLAVSRSAHWVSLEQQGGTQLSGTLRCHCAPS